MLDCREIKFKQLEKIFRLLLLNDNAIHFWTCKFEEDNSHLSEKMLNIEQEQYKFLIDSFDDTFADLREMFNTVQKENE